MSETDLTRPPEDLLEACIEATRRDWLMRLPGARWSRPMAERDILAAYPLIARQIAEATRAAILAAYREGFTDGRGGRFTADAARALARCWPESATRAALPAILPAGTTDKGVG